MLVVAGEEDLLLWEVWVEVVVVEEEVAVGSNIVVVGVAAY